MFKLSMTGDQVLDRLNAAHSLDDDINDTMYFAKVDVSNNSNVLREGLGFSDGSSSILKLGSLEQSQVNSQRPVSQRPYVRDPESFNPKLIIPYGTHFIRASYDVHFSTTGRYVVRLQIINQRTVIKDQYLSFSDQSAGAKSSFEVSTCFTIGSKDNKTSMFELQIYMEGTTMTSVGAGHIIILTELTLHSLPDFN